MDESLKVIVDKHWSTLVRYVNPTQTLLTVLVEDRVLPATMVNELQKGATRREKNEILLKLIKLKGNTSYRKFRDAMLKAGQIFIADLLYEEESPMSFVEESDFSGFPAFKLSLSPAVLNQFILLLDAKIRARVLKKEWKTNSNSRLEHLMSRVEDSKTRSQALDSAQEKDRIKQLTAEMSVKNDVIRSLSLDINILNAEQKQFNQVDAFLQRCSPCSGRGHGDLDKSTNFVALAEPHTAPSAPRGQTGVTPWVHIPLTPRGHTGITQRLHTSTDCVSSRGHQEKPAANRFSDLDNALTLINGQLLTILGLPLPQEGEVTSIGFIIDNAGKVQKLVAELREHLQQTIQDRQVALKMLDPDTEQTGTVTMVTGVGRHLQQEQQKRFFLLKDIDRLSRKLRGMSSLRPKSGLFSLLQSAVTGQPEPVTVDYRFLSNHISLLEADAEHIQKKMSWKEEDVKALQQELSARKSSGGDNMAATTSSGLDLGVVDASEVDLRSS